MPERAVSVKSDVWARWVVRVGAGDVCLGWVGSGVVGHGGLAPGTLVWVEADRFGCLDIPSPRTTRVVGMERSGHSRAGLNHISRRGSCRYTSSQPDGARTSRHVVEATDLSVAEPVVDEREQLAGGSDPTDVAAAPFRHPPVGVPDGWAAVVAGDRLDR